MFGQDNFPFSFGWAIFYSIRKVSLWSRPQLSQLGWSWMGYPWLGFRLRHPQLNINWSILNTTLPRASLACPSLRHPHPQPTLAYFPITSMSNLKFLSNLKSIMWTNL